MFSNSLRIIGTLLKIEEKTRRCISIKRSDDFLLKIIQSRVFVSKLLKVHIKHLSEMDRLLRPILEFILTPMKIF